MSFSELEARIAAQVTVDTETQPSDPKWLAYKHVHFDVDGLVHRVVSMHGWGAAVHDELMIEIQPWTGCNIPLHALAVEGKDDPECAGFRRETTALTCVTCASGLVAAGDVQRQVNKQLLFGAAYGLKSVSQTVLSTSRQAGKTHMLRQFAKYQQFTDAMVLGYAAHDAANVLAQRAYRRFSMHFRHVLAQMVLPP